MAALKTSMIKENYSESIDAITKTIEENAKSIEEDQEELNTGKYQAINQIIIFTCR